MLNCVLYLTVWARKWQETWLLVGNHDSGYENGSKEN